MGCPRPDRHRHQRASARCGPTDRARVHLLLDVIGRPWPVRHGFLEPLPARPHAHRGIDRSSVGWPRCCCRGEIGWSSDCGRSPGSVAALVVRRWPAPGVGGGGDPV